MRGSDVDAAVWVDREEDVVATSVHRRAEQFTPGDVAVARRRVEQETVEFKIAYKIRSGIEATNGHLKNERGLRRLRQRGSPGVSLRVLFKCLAELRGSRPGSTPSKIIADPHIKEVEFFSFNQAPGLGLAPWLQPESEQGILKNLEVGAHHLGADSGLARNISVI